MTALEESVGVSLHKCVVSELASMSLKTAGLVDAVQ